MNLCFGDGFMNIPHLPGLDGLVLRLIGSTGGPRVTPLAKLAMVGKNRPEFAAHLRELSAMPNLARLIPSHGAIVAADAGAVLRQAADGV